MAHERDSNIILLVEDTDSDAALVSSAFDRAGIANPIHRVADGELAVSYLQGIGTYADRKQHPLPAVILLDPQGIIVTWNPGGERIKGYSADEIIGQHFSVFYPAEDLQAGKPEFELAVASRTGRFEDENWRLRKDGSRFWANVTITRLNDE